MQKEENQEIKQLTQLSYKERLQYVGPGLFSLEKRQVKKDMAEAYTIASVIEKVKLVLRKK